MKPFYNNIIFRLTAPALFGVVIYLLILMFFDSVSMLASNFFSREVLFTIGLNYLFFESQRLLIVLLNRILPKSLELSLRMLIQFVLSQTWTVFLVSQVLRLYFINIEGFSTIRTELITFNFLYIFITFFYHLYFFSQRFLYQRNEEMIRTEKMKKDNLELALEEYKNQINPGFLFQSLEILIHELYNDRKKADELIGRLAGVYRYLLDNRENELVSFKKEKEQIMLLLEIFSSRYPEAIQILDETNGDTDTNLVPGTFQVLFEKAVMQNMVSEHMPMTFSFSMNGDALRISHNINEKLIPLTDDNNKLEKLSDTYRHLTGRAIAINTEKSIQYYTIPHIRVEEE